MWSKCLVVLVAMFVSSGEAQERRGPGSTGDEQRHHGELDEARVAELEPDDASQERGASRRSDQPGLEVALVGTRAIVRGHDFRLSGTVFEVGADLSLSPRANAQIQSELCAMVQTPSAPIQPVGDARIQPPVLVTEECRTFAQANFRSGADGHFALDVPVPTNVGVLPAKIKLRVTARGARMTELEYPLRVESAHDAQMLTDRIRYQPGETLRALVLVRDRTSRRPVSNLALRYRLSQEVDGALYTFDADVALQTGASGAASLERSLDGLTPGNYRLTVDTSDGLPLTARSIVISERSTDRFVVTLTPEALEVPPSSTASFVAHVETLDGHPIAGAQVTRQVDGPSAVVANALLTNERGDATLAVMVPHGEGSHFAVRVSVTHPSYGTQSATASVLIEGHGVLVEHTVETGALVPGVPTRVWVRVEHRGRLAPGAEVELVGFGCDPNQAGVSHAQAQTDEHGVATFVVNVPVSVLPYVTDTNELPYGVRVRASAQRSDGQPPASYSSALTFPFHPHSRALLRVDAPVVTGTRVPFTLYRAEDDAASYVVEAVSQGRVVGHSNFPRSTRGGVLVLNEPVIGPLTLYLRGQQAPRFSSPNTVGRSTYLASTSTTIFVRPTAVFAASITAADPVVPVRGHTELVLSAQGLFGSPDPAQYFGALVVRDMATLVGEPEFRFAEAYQAVVSSLTEHGPGSRLLWFGLGQAIDGELVAGAQPVGDSLWRSDEARGGSETVLRDPLVLLEDHVRQTALELMPAIETALSEAMAQEPESFEDGDVEDGDDDEEADEALGNPSRRAQPAQRSFLRGADFRPDLIEWLTEQGSLDAGTLELPNGQPLTLAMLRRIDPTFTFETVARRLVRLQLAKLLSAIHALTSDERFSANPVASNPESWLGTLVGHGHLSLTDLFDPWGRPYRFAPVRSRTPRFQLAVQAQGYDLYSVGPDGRAETSDDLFDPFARAVNQNSLYAHVSGENEWMEQLSATSIEVQSLSALLTEFRRRNWEVSEEEVGSLVTASRSEMLDQSEDSFGYGGLGLRGSGAGGSGYASGSLGVGRMGSIGQGSGHGTAFENTGFGTGFAGGVSRLLRQEFPATLLFVPEVTFVGNRASVNVQTRDAVTGYRAESMVWSDEGWTAFAKTQFGTRQDYVLAAELPPFARLGDRMLVPLRVENRSTQPIRAIVNITSDDPAIQFVNPEATEVPPGQVGALSAALNIGSTDGTLRDLQVMFTLSDGSGEIQDRLQLPLSVLPDVVHESSRQTAFLAPGESRNFDVPGQEPGSADVLLVTEHLLGDPRAYLERGQTPFGDAIPQRGGQAVPFYVWYCRYTGCADGVDAAMASLPFFSSASLGDSSDPMSGILAWQRETSTNDPTLLAQLADQWTSNVNALNPMQLSRVLFAMGHVQGPTQPALSLAYESLASAVRTRLLDQVAGLTGSSALLWAAAGLQRSWPAQSVQEGSAIVEALLERTNPYVIRHGGYAWIESPLSPYERVQETALFILASESLPNFASLRSEMRAELLRLATLSAGWNPEVWYLVSAALHSASARSAEAEGDSSPGAHPERLPVMFSALSGAPRQLFTTDQQTFRCDDTFTSGFTLRNGLSPGLAVVEAAGTRPYATSQTGPVRLTELGSVGHFGGDSAIVFRVENTSLVSVSDMTVEVSLPAALEIAPTSVRSLERTLGGVAVDSGRLSARVLRVGPSEVFHLVITGRWTAEGQMLGLGVVVQARGPLSGARVIGESAPRLINVPHDGPEVVVPPLRELVLNYRRDLDLRTREDAYQPPELNGLAREVW